MAKYIMPKKLILVLYQKVSKLRRVMIKTKQGNQKPIAEFVKTRTFLKAGEMAVL